MTVSKVWRDALSIIADFSPMTYWRMSNGAALWWTLSSRAQLLDDRFTEQPFLYPEIVSVCVVSEVRFREEVLSCDWPALHQGLLSVSRLHVDEILNLEIPPASPPNRALRLTAR